MIHIITGDGKGKTSSAVGMTIRMSGYNKKILFAQFLKGSDSGEINILSSLSNITVMRLSKNYGFLNTMSTDEKEQIKKEHNQMLNHAISNSFDMIVLDEAIPAMNFNVLDKELLFNVLKKSCEIVLTGRDADERLIKYADYISEIKKIQHPFDSGIPARKGVEF